MRSIGGLLAFFGIQTLLKYALASDPNPARSWRVQASLSASLNPSFNLPTVRSQGQVGYAYKAVARHQGASRFCALRQLWPYIRGREGPG
jgi:hypothetical protein